MKEAHLKKPVLIILAILIFFGVFCRFYHITENEFFFYDEGLYLDHNLDFLYYMERKPATSFRLWFRYLEVVFHVALADGKFLWFFLSALRGFFVGPEGWFFTRLLSAIFGSLTIAVTFLFARQYYKSFWVGLLAATILAVLPSHVFYSRLGLQEGLSTFCFISGLYFYFTSRTLSYRTFLSGFLFACVFFTNYRMIILPFIIAFCELVFCFQDKTKPNYRVFTWSTLTFLLVVFLVGNIDNGANTKITFAWMFYQAYLAQKASASFDILNIFSYPYYVFKLESVLVGFAFFGNVYFIVKKKWREALPFILVLLQMFIFSFALEKGVRYLCVMLPLLSTAVAALSMEFFNTLTFKYRSIVCGIFMAALFLHLAFKANMIRVFKGDYQTSMKDLLLKNKMVKVISTQPLIQKIYTPKAQNAFAVPHQMRFLYYLYVQGYQYLIIDPQAYISHTEDNERFTPKLQGYLGFITQFVKPEMVYRHYNKPMLERFVLEHNVNLRKSLHFLNNAEEHFGLLKIYDISKCIVAIQARQAVYQHGKE